MAASQATQTAEAVATDESDGLAAGERLSIEEMTRIMDVAATLRKERAIVDQQLNIDEIKAKLRERLLEAAKVSGDPVTAEEVDAAVDQYYDRLHEFREPPASFATFLAHAWALRTRIFKWVGGILAGVAAIVAISMALTARAVTRASRLFELSLADQRAIMRWDDAKPLAQELEAKMAAAKEALDARDMAALNRIQTEMAALRREFDIQYEATIPSSPDEQSATERVWNDGQGRRANGYFVVVTARDDEGDPVEVNIHNREADRTERVSRWGEQVPEAVFNRLEADKKADGVLDERQFGVKPRGKRELEVTLKGEDGRPIPRGGQITSW
jgi:hypothetical protein